MLRTISTAVFTVAAALCLVVARPADAHLASGSFRLDAQQEIPPPSPAAEIADGTAILTLVQVATPGGGMTFTLQYDVIVRNLTGVPIAAHIHAGIAGTSGPAIHALTFTSATPGAGELVGEVTGLTFGDVEDILAERTYLNVHTAENPGGEVRGQIRLVGVCQCSGPTNADRKTLKQCIKSQARENNYEPRALKQFFPDKTARRDVLQLVKRVTLLGKKSGCGPTKASFTASCCLPADGLGIIAGPPCAAVKNDAQCRKLGGTFVAGAACTVTANPCRPRP